MTKPVKKSDTRALAVRVVCIVLAALMVFSVVISFLPFY